MSPEKYHDASCNHPASAAVPDVRINSRARAVVGLRTKLDGSPAIPGPRGCPKMLQGLGGPHIPPAASSTPELRTNTASPLLALPHKRVKVDHPYLAVM